MGLSPKRPSLQDVVARGTRLDNVGACLPYYYSWTGQDVDT